MEKMRSELLGTMPVGKLMFRTAGPIMLSMFVQAMYNLVDSMFVAAVSEKALSALSISFSIQALIGAIGLGFGTGASSVLSKALAEKDSEKVKKTAGGSVMAIFLAWLVFLFFGLFLVQPFFRWMTDDPEIITSGTVYLSIISTFAFGMMSQQIFERQLQATGRSLLSMIAQMSGAIINVVLDPVFIFGYFGIPAMGVRGAAIASVIGQLVSATLAIGFCLTRNKEIPIRIRYIRFYPDIILESVKIGAGTGIMLVLASVMTFFASKIFIGINETAVAVYGAYSKLQSLTMIPVQGLGSAMVPILSYNYGIRCRERIERSFRLSLIFGEAYMVLFALLFVLCPGFLLGLFSAGVAMREIGIPAFRILASGYIFAGFSMTSLTLLQVFNRWHISVFVSIIRQTIPLLPLLWVLSILLDIRFSWIAFPVSECLAAVVALWHVVSVFRKEIFTLDQI